MEREFSARRYVNASGVPIVQVFGPGGITLRMLDHEALALAAEITGILAHHSEQQWSAADRAIEGMLENR